MDLPFRATRLDLPIESEHVDRLLDRAEASDDGAPLLVALAGVRRRTADAVEDDIAAALLGWAAAHRTLHDLRLAIATTRERLTVLRRDDAALTLATAHATKGLEFDHVIVLGMEAGRFPSARAVEQSDDPGRAYEEERRLGYVAWTRARRSLTLVYDPSVPSPFLLEAFSPAELGLAPAITR